MYRRSFLILILRIKRNIFKNAGKAAAHKTVSSYQNRAAAIQDAIPPAFTGGSASCVIRLKAKINLLQEKNMTSLLFPLSWYP